MSSSILLRSVGARRALLINARALHTLYSPFGASEPRATLSAIQTENSFTESGLAGRLNVVASAPVQKFRGVPLGAYPMSTPYYGSGPLSSSHVQAGIGAADGGQVAREDMAHGSSGGTLEVRLNTEKSIIGRQGNNAREDIPSNQIAQVNRVERVGPGATWFKWFVRTSGKLPKVE
ncbi:hypothetical protein B0H10DRAFT_1938550 [Mycena sp. CBHHK59/15]|nr:hypothetical protein B0H10DRAFT_1938550 [Mycena sp. CBHHK59/15]